MGLTRAAVGAVGGTMADQWKEFFYCDAIDKDVLVVKGEKRVGGRSSNKKGSDNIISSGSGIAVADGQCMIIVEQGKVVEVCAEPGQFTYDASTEPSIFAGSLGEGIHRTFDTVKKRFTFGGDTGKDQRVYYFNTKELVDNKFGTANPIPFRVVDRNIGLDIDVSVRCNGIYSYKQDWFIKEKYMPELQKDDMSFLSRSFERHFNERPYLKHSCYLYLTKTTKERNRMQSNFSTLCRGHIIPKELDKETAGKFMEAAEQFERIMNDSGFVRLRRLSTDEIVGTEKSAGLIERYFSLMPEGDTTLQDIDLSAKEMRIGDNRLCLHTLSDAEDMPGKVATDIRYEKLSTDRSDCRLSFASPVGLLLSCNHIYNQYVIIDNSEENLQKFEKSARNMQSLSRYSRSNSINREWIDQYLNEAHSYGLTSVRAHFNVMAWSDDAEELKHIKNDVGSQLASMECVPHHNTIDCPTLYWAAMPGNAADFPAEESFHTFIEQAVCLFTEETNYRSSLSPFGIKMVDRLTGKPLHLDISDLPMKRGITTNRNKFVLGPSGSGKSFFMNHLVRQYYEQGTHVVLVDTGNSYQGLCEMIRCKTNGADGVYFTYTEEKPISFNPFYTDDYVFDVEKKDSIKTLLLTSGCHCRPLRLLLWI